MIYIEELRIGNVVYYNNTKHIITVIYGDNHVSLDNEEIVDISQIFPIPSTPINIIYLGAEKEVGDNELFLGRLRFTLYNRFTIIYMDIVDYPEHVINSSIRLDEIEKQKEDPILGSTIIYFPGIYYIQNLYYFLNNKELNIDYFMSK